MTYAQLSHYLEAQNFADVSTIILKLQRYANLLSETNKVMDLTAVKDEDTVEKHFYDSLLLGQLHNFNNESLIDIGSGAGLPGMVLAIAFPTLQVTLLEPTKKRCNFLETVINDLQLNNVKVINLRAEEYITEKRELFDLATARAVANLPILLELTMPFLKVEGLFIAMKGSNAEEELLLSKNSLKTLSTIVIKTQKHQLPSEGHERNNILFKKLKSTNVKYPRAYAVIKKKPL